MPVQKVEPRADSSLDGEDDLSRHSRGCASGAFVFLEIALMSVIVAFIYGLAKLA